MDDKELPVIDTVDFDELTDDEKQELENGKGDDEDG